MAANTGRELALSRGSLTADHGVIEPQRCASAGDFAVLYVWEVQVEERAQRKGLGRFLMQLLELIARKCAL